MQINQRAQGAIEYLLIIGAAILVVAVVIIAVSGIMVEGKDSVDENKTTVVANPLRESLADSRGQYFLPANTDREYIYVGGATTLGELLDSFEDKSQIESICYNEGTDVYCDASTQIRYNKLLLIKSKGNTTIPKTNLVDVTKPVKELTWSEDFPPIAVDFDKVCVNKFGEGWRMPSTDELVSAMARYFLQEKSPPVFINNRDYWSFNSECGPTQGFVMWWNFDTTRGGSCVNYPSGSYSWQSIKCVKD